MRWIFLLLSCCSLTVEADEKKRIDSLRKSMEVLGIWKEDMTLEPLSKSGYFAAIKRRDKIVGYYYEEYCWEPKDLSKVDLAGVTEIQYDQNFLEGEKPAIVVSDSDEIQLWVGAYKNHTEHQRGWMNFVPLSDQAGFKHLREEFDYGGVFMNGAGISFRRNGEKEPIFVKGNFSEQPHMDIRSRNEVLHLLVKARYPKPKPVQEPTKEKKLVDPFACGVEGDLERD